MNKVLVIFGSFFLVLGLLGSAAGRSDALASDVVVELTIVSEVVGGSASPSDFSFLIGGDIDPDVRIEHGEAIEVPLGSVIINEVSVDDYYLSAANCESAGLTIDNLTASPGVVSFDVASSGSVTCTLTSEFVPPPSDVTLKVLSSPYEQAVPDDFSFLVNDEVLEHGDSVSLPVGDLVSVTQDELDGFFLYDITCSYSGFDLSLGSIVSGTEFTPSAGGFVTCTFFSAPDGVTPVTTTTVVSDDVIPDAVSSNASVSVVVEAFDVESSSWESEVLVGDVGDVLWRVTLLNSGDVDLSSVRLDSSVDACDRVVGVLDASDSLFFECSSSGLFSNVVNVSASASDDVSVADSSEAVADVSGSVVTTTGGFPVEATMLVSDTPAVSLDKQVFDVISGEWASSGTVSFAGDATWRVTVTNSGSVGLTDVVVVDEFASGCSKDVGVLGVGEFVVIECTSAGDYTLGTRTNIASVSGSDGVSDSDSASVYFAGTIVPGTIVPGSSVPGSSVPDAVSVSSSVPGSSVPDGVSVSSSVPGSSVPDAVSVSSSVPGSSVPGSSVVSSSEPTVSVVSSSVPVSVFSSVVSQPVAFTGGAPLALIIVGFGFLLLGGFLAAARPVRSKGQYAR